MLNVCVFLSVDILCKCLQFVYETCRLLIPGAARARPKAWPAAAIVSRVVFEGDGSVGGWLEVEGGGVRGEGVPPPRPTRGSGERCKLP